MQAWGRFVEVAVEATWRRAAGPVQASHQTPPSVLLPQGQVRAVNQATVGRNVATAPWSIPAGDRWQEAGVLRRKPAGQALALALVRPGGT